MCKNKDQPNIDSRYLIFNFATTTIIYQLEKKLLDQRDLAIK